MTKDLTVAEIKKVLDDLGIEYDNKARKDDLLKLLGNTKEETPKKKRSYVVTCDCFKDLQDNNKIYRKGDKYNHVGKSKERIAELSSTKNKIGKILIKETD